MDEKENQSLLPPFVVRIMTSVTTNQTQSPTKQPSDILQLAGSKSKESQVI